MTPQPDSIEEKLPLESLAPNLERFEKLQELYPDAFVEGKLDAEKLQQIFGEDLATGAERYGLSWAGKSDAIKSIQSLSTGTLLPCRDESINFDSTENIIIEGDNLEVLKLLQRSYYGKIKMIYIDPPYNTGGEFIYPDNYKEGLQEYLRFSRQVSDAGYKLTTNTETSGRYHSRWLTMMYPRLFLARNLLREDGVIFISIDDHEIANLQLVLNEVFGEENSIGIICWKNVTDNNPTLINKDNEFLLVYARSKTQLPEAWKSLVSDAKDLLQAEYKRLKSDRKSNVEVQQGIREFISHNVEAVGFLSRYKNVDDNGVYTGSESVHNPRAGGYDFEVLHPDTKRPMRKPANGYRFPETTFRDLDRQRLILYGEDENRIVKIKKYLQEYEDTLRSVIVLDGRLGSYDLKRVFNTDKSIFSNPKPVDLLKSFISYSTSAHDIVLDLFGGSGTTAQAVLDLNELNKAKKRSFILVQLPEPVNSETIEGKNALELGLKTISEIGKERVRRVINKLESGQVKELFENETMEPDRGFQVFKLNSSNFKIWDPEGAQKDEKELAAQLKLMVHNVVDDRGHDDLLYELILKSGLLLTSKIEKLTVAGLPALNIENGTLIVCLARPISQEALREIIALNPQRVLCLDVAFAGNDQLKTNIVLEMKSHAIEFRTV